MSKRSNGEGSIRKQPGGTWRAEIMDGYTSEGKRHIVRFSGKTKAEVREKIREYQRLLEEDVHIDKSMSFTKWAEMWYADYKSMVRASTYSGYKYTLKLLAEHFGETEIAKILPIHINRFFDVLADRGYSLSLIRKCRAMLIQIFTAAENNGLIAKNPAIRAKKVGKRTDAPAAESRKDAFTDDELQTLFQELPSDLMGNAIRFLLASGLRVQELLALNSDDISEDGSRVTVSKAITTVDGMPRLGSTKSRSSYRIVPIPEEYRGYAIYLRNQGDGGLIFRGKKDGTLYSVGAFRRKYYTTLSHIDGVRKLSPHCCRHTYATQLEKRGVPLRLIAKLMGHSGMMVTDVYLHTDMDTLSDAVSKLNGGHTS